MQSSLKQAEKNPFGRIVSLGNQRGVPNLQSESNRANPKNLREATGISNNGSKRTLQLAVETSTHNR